VIAAATVVLLAATSNLSTPIRSVSRVVVVPSTVKLPVTLMSVAVTTPTFALRNTISSVFFRTALPVLP